MSKPTNIEAAEYYQQVARYYARRGDLDKARASYFQSIVMWDEIRTQLPELALFYYKAKEECTRFAKTDKTYGTILREFKVLASEHPGINKADLFSILGKYRKEDLGYTMYVAQKEGEIFQDGEGHVYELKLPSWLFE